MRIARIIFLFCTTGFAWYFAMRSLFVWSGAQKILADPALQSVKFIKAFTEYEPLPRMAANNLVLWGGFGICGLFSAMAFLLVNHRLNGRWWKRGLTFGLLHWLLLVPWFEFYLPYNVMNEPLQLVLFEALLWLVVFMLIGIYASLIVNYGTDNRN